MKSLKKLVSVLLALLMLIPAVGCSPDVEENVETSQNVSTDTGNAEVKSGIPDGFSLNGKEIRILARNTDLRQMDVDGGGTLTGDVVYDAVCKRNASVEELLQTKFVVTAMDGDWAQFGTSMETSLLAGDDNWDIINAPGNASCTAQRDYLFYELQDAKYISYDNPYWNTEAMEEISVDGKKIRYLVGDVSLSMHHYSGAMFFNKVLFEDGGFNPDDLYQLVIDRKWTLEKLEEYSLMLYVDTNGDGVNDDNDIMGFTIFTTEDAKYLEYGMDVRRYVRNSNGIVEMNYDMDRANTAVDKLLTLLFSTPGARYTRTAKRNYDIFTGGNTVFLGGLMGFSFYTYLRNMDDPYGIIPYPMLDENQEEYTNYIHNSAAFYCVPLTCKDLDSACAALEALCYESYKSVVGIYFETALKAKYVSDLSTGECIDIIRAVSKKYFLAEHNTMVDYGGHLIAKQLTAGQNMLSSDYAGIKDTANKKIVELVDKLNQLEKQ